MFSAVAKYENGEMKHEVISGEHHLIADVSKEEGGENLGPSPHDYLAIALASCTAITLRMYARRKLWSLQSAETLVIVDHQKDLTKFDRRINLIGDLNEEQRKRLLEIANHCPVHKALSGKIEITTTLA